MNLSQFCLIAKSVSETSLLRSLPGRDSEQKLRHGETRAWSLTLQYKEALGHRGEGRNAGAGKQRTCETPQCWQSRQAGAPESPCTGLVPGWTQGEPADGVKWPQAEISVHLDECLLGWTTLPDLRPPSPCQPWRGSPALARAPVS